MKTFLSVIDSYDEIIFPPNLSFFMMKFELVPGRCFFHWCSPVSSVGKDGWNEWKSWSKSKIGIHRIYF